MKKYLLKAVCALTAALLCACGAQSGLKEPNKNYQSIDTEGKIMESISQNITIVDINKKTFKSAENANPISSLVFCADPTAVEYEGRLYVYGTRDHQQFEASMNEDADNTYEKIRSFVIFSTDDMVNWTYEGDINTGEIAPWIWASWAPSITSRVEEDGLTHFYLYFSNSGAGVGVITSTSPVGPWSDPLGRPLVDGGTPGLKDCPNPFDPGVVIDDNGVGWLSFGGGIKEGGSEAYPGSARIVKLGKDMISFDSEFSEIPAPYFFEASELNYINGTYVYTCCSSWGERYLWEYKGYEKPMGCSMIYMTSKDPLNTESWKYRGDYFLNPGNMGYKYANNHTHLHKFDGKYYIFNHSLGLMEAKKKNGGFRSLCVDEIEVNERTLEITQTGTNLSGVPQIRKLNGMGLIQGETMATCSVGIAIEKLPERMAVTASGDKAEWILLKNAELEECDSFFATVKGKGRIELRLDSLENAPCAWLEFDCEDYTTIKNTVTEKFSGTHDIYVVISSGAALDEWQLQ